MGMKQVKVQVSKYVDDSQPGWVECTLIDVNDREWVFVEKVPVVTTKNLNKDSTYPDQGFIACEVVSSEALSNGRSVVEIDTSNPYDIESVDGVSRFTIYKEALE